MSSSSNKNEKKMKRKIRRQGDDSKVQGVCEVRLQQLQFLPICNIFRLQPLGIVSDHTTTEECFGVLPGEFLALPTG